MTGHVKIDGLFIYIVNNQIVLVTKAYSPFIYQTWVATWNLRETWLKDAYSVTTELSIPIHRDSIYNNYIIYSIKMKGNKK